MSNWRRRRLVTYSISSGIAAVSSSFVFFMSINMLALYANTGFCGKSVGPTSWCSVTSVELLISSMSTLSSLSYCNDCLIACSTFISVTGSYLLTDLEAWWCIISKSVIAAWAENDDDVCICSQGIFTWEVVKRFCSFCCINASLHLVLPFLLMCWLKFASEVNFSSQFLQVIKYFLHWDESMCLLSSWNCIWHPGQYLRRKVDASFNTALSLFLLLLEEEDIIDLELCSYVHCNDCCIWILTVVYFCDGVLQKMIMFHHYHRVIFIPKLSASSVTQLNCLIPDILLCRVTLCISLQIYNWLNRASNVTVINLCFFHSHHVGSDITYIIHKYKGILLLKACI